MVDELPDLVEVSEVVEVVLVEMLHFIDEVDHEVVHEDAHEVQDVRGWCW